MEEEQIEDIEEQMEKEQDLLEADDETELPEDLDYADENMFPSAE